MSMLHSVWQAALLLALYGLVNVLGLKKAAPQDKRNVLVLILLSQCLLFLVTFCLYYFSVENSAAIALLNDISDSFSPQNGLLQQLCPWLFTAYALVVGYKISKATYGWYHFKQRYRNGLQKPSIDLRLFTASTAYQLGIKKKVTLWLSNSINTPVTFGFLKPVILLPVALVNRIAVKQAETLILHELTHIRINDYLLNWCMMLAEAVFFFNPFVLYACRSIRLEREKHCDMSVIAFKYPVTLYAETLLEAERFKSAVPACHLAAVGKKQQLLHRIRFFSTSESLPRSKRTRLILPLFAFFVASTMLAGLFLRPVTGTIAASIAAPELPAVVNTMETTGPVIHNDPFITISDKALRDVATGLKKQLPVIQKQLKKIDPLVRSLQRKAERLAEIDNETILMPAAATEADGSSQVVIKEEHSGSASTSVKIYQLSFIKGRWVLVPQIMATAKPLAKDSTLPGVQFRTIDQQ